MKQASCLGFETNHYVPGVISGSCAQRHNLVFDWCRPSTLVFIFFPLPSTRVVVAVSFFPLMYVVVFSLAFNLQSVLLTCVVCFSRSLASS